MIGDTSGLFTDDDPRTMLAGIMSPTPAAELVGPPPDSPPPHQAGQTTPLTGTLAAAPKEAVAKNLDTALGRTSYNTRLDTQNFDPRNPAQMDTGNAVPGAARMTLASNTVAPQNLTGVSNPPNGGYVNSISQAQPVQAAQPVQPAQQVRPAQPAMPNAVNGTLTSVMPQLPQAAPQQVQPDKLNMQTMNAQSRLAQLTSSGSGVSQIQNPFLRGLARVGDVAGSIIAPGVTAAIPGTTLHNQQLIARQQGVVGNLQGQQTAAAQQADIASQTAERTALGQKATALAGADTPRPVTAEEARQAGSPGLEGSVMRPSDIGGLLKQGVKNTGLAGVTAEKLGLKQNEDGSFVEDPGNPMTQVRKSKEDVEASQETLNKAKADAANADPSTPAGRMALAKLQSANAGHDAAMTRARASWGNYLMHSKGVDLDNTPLPAQSQITDDSGNTTGIGTAFQEHATKQQAQVAQFNDVLGSLNNLEGKAKAMDKKGGKFNDPAIAAALADPTHTAAQWAQGVVKSTLSPEQRDYVIAKKSFDENLQALRKASGGTSTESSVNRLIATAPGASTPDLDYLLRQTSQVRQQAQRLSKGIPNIHGGHTVEGSNAPPSGLGGQIPPEAAKLLVEGKLHTFNNGQQWTLQAGKPVRIK